MSGEGAARRGEWVYYEWAVVRLVPRVHLGQFGNAGVILHARTVEFLDALLEPRWEALRALAPELDRLLVERHLDAYLRICRAEDNAGPVALLPPSERFHWLIAPRSAVVQTSPVHSGRCRDPRAALEQLLCEQCPRASEG